MPSTAAGVRRSRVAASARLGGVGGSPPSMAGPAALAKLMTASQVFCHMTDYILPIGRLFKGHPGRQPCGHRQSGFPRTRSLHAMARQLSTTTQFLLRARALVSEVGAHVRHAHPLGSNPHRLRDCARDHMGRDTMDGVAAGVPARVGSGMVPPRFVADLSAACILLVVVSFRRLRADHLCRRRRHRRVRRVRFDRRRHRHVGVSGARSQECRHLWFGALGDGKRGARRRTARSRWRRARTIRRRLSCATTDRSMCSASRRPDRARASASSCRRC